MPNLLLVGPSNNGKTMIVEKFRRSHLPGSEENARDGAIRVPVLKVQMPPAPDERGSSRRSSKRSARRIGSTIGCRPNKTRRSG